MKTFILFLAPVFILMSCGTSKGFQRQKFTKLKKIDSQFVESEKKTDDDTYVEEVNNYSVDEEEAESIQQVEERETIHDEKTLVQPNHLIESASFDKTENLNPSEEIFADDEESYVADEPIEDSDFEDEENEEESPVLKKLRMATILFAVGVVAAITQAAGFIMWLTTDLGEVLLLESGGNNQGMFVDFYAGLVAFATLMTAFILSTPAFTISSDLPTKKDNRRAKLVWIFSLCLMLFMAGNLLFVSMYMIINS